MATAPKPAGPARCDRRGGITALTLTSTSSFLDAVITSVAHPAIDQPNAGVLSYIDGLRTTLLTLVALALALALALVFVEATAVVDTNPASSRTDAAAIILIAGSALVGCRLLLRHEEFHQ